MAASLRDHVTSCPSCGKPAQIDDEKGVWRCACGNGGDLFDYVMQARDCTFVEALNYLADPPPLN